MGILKGVTDRLREETPERPYECLQCDARLEVEYYVCPECGSFSIDRRSILV